MRSAPHKDRFISDDELKYIESMVGVEENEKRVIPWMSILTSKPVLGITVAQFSMNWGYNTMLTQMPTFLAGLLNALPLNDGSNFKFSFTLQTH